MSREAATELEPGHDIELLLDYRFENDHDGQITSAVAASRLKRFCLAFVLRVDTRSYMLPSLRDESPTQGAVRPVGVDDPDSFAGHQPGTRNHAPGTIHRTLPSRGR